jgi:transcriptional regulator with XRE-family HTH domain
MEGRLIVSDLVKDSLKALGIRLREERLRRNDTQKVFAARIGVSVPTLYKMESGDHRVQLGHWAVALDLLGHMEDLNQLLTPKENLFAKYEQTQKPKRQRASRKGGQ